jgi:potassium efflux system protein
VIIPNSEFITSAVKNMTHSDTLGRIIIKVRAAYDSDIDALRDILIGCACDHPQVLATPAPAVFLIAFGDIGLELELRCIVTNVNYALTVKSDLQMTILQRFRTVGITIPVMPHEEHRIATARAATKDAQST